MTLRPAAFLIALAASSVAWGDAPDAPARIAYLAYAEGEVTFQSGRSRPTSGLPERLLRAGDRIATGPDGRAELLVGTAIVRLDAGTQFALTRFEETGAGVELRAGVASLHYRPLYAEERFEIRTPHSTVALDAPGEYRVDVGTALALTVYEGAASLTTADGPLRVAGGQRVSLERPGAVASLLSLPPTDAFDDWVLERELRLAAAAPPVDAGIDGYEELAIHGDWYATSSFGYVWSPYYTGHWTPFRHGRWQRDGHGWSWADSSPWGFFLSFSNGQWAFLYSVNRWCWVPAPAPTPHGGTVARYTKPYGRPSGPARPSFAGIEQDVTSSGSTGGTSIFHSFGGGTSSRSSVSTSSWSGGATMRPTGSSFGRPRATSGSGGRGGSIYANSGNSGSPR